MIPARYRWEWKQPDVQTAQQWSARLGIPPLAARVLLSRGFSEEDAAAFFGPTDETAFLDPLDMKGMSEAATRIRNAIADGERIRVYGDYDADGVSSTALMIRLLTMMDAIFDTYIPHRSLEGYGLNLSAIDLAAEAGVSLIVTVDNGISAVEQIAYAKLRGIDVVVTDHHEPPAVLPDAAVALVNPKQPGCPYPFKGLCGAGVAFKLAHVLLGRLPVELADLAAIGTVADLMPLTGENRSIVRLGLDRMRKRPSAGIRALAEVCGTVTAELSSGRIGFGLAPRLNAGGRLDRADGAVRLLTTDDESEAQELARDLDRLNAERQRLVEATVEEAERMWREKRETFGGDGPDVIVLSKQGWNAGIAGLVASKLVERHYRPAVILAEDAANGTCKGSARSVDGFDLYAALTDCADVLLHFGGHQAAAGMTLHTDKAGELEAKLHRIAGERMQPEDWLPKKRADLACTLAEATLEAADALGRLEPFGNGNPTPRLLVKDVTISACKAMGKDGKHIRLTVEQSGRTLEAVGFGMGELAELLGPGRKLDLLGELSVNEWNGTRRAQLTIQDMKCDELNWIDRRKSPPDNVWQEIGKMAAAYDGQLIVLCAALPQTGDGGGAIVRTYAEAAGGTFGLPESAPAAEAPERRRSSAAPRRKLALFGLPDNEQDMRLLLGMLSEADAGWESVYLFAGKARHATPPVLDRNDFARVYALFREQGTWIDGPEGFPRRAAETSGLPLASVRLIQEVFEELGFIRARGAERSIVPNAPRRKLEQSERYARMVRQADAASFPEWPLDRLKEWAANPPNPRDGG